MSLGAVDDTEISSVMVSRFSSLPSLGMAPPSVMVTPLVMGWGSRGLASSMVVMDIVGSRVVTASVIGWTSCVVAISMVVMDTVGSPGEIGVVTASVIGWTSCVVDISIVAVLDTVGSCEVAGVEASVVTCTLPPSVLPSVAITVKK